MTTPNVFFQISKVDEAKRLVYGRATDETPDKADEIFDYATSKPHFEAWSEEVKKASGGKSQGNIRSMHGKIAAGKVVAMNFDDAAKAVDITAQIVDDNEWNKVLEGVHTGFSIGGRYIGERWADKTHVGKMRYTAAPSEISLVDRPCNPGATFFDIHKADGDTLQKAFVHQPVAEEVVTGESLGNEMEQLLKDGVMSLADMQKAIQAAALAKKEDVAAPTEGEAAAKADEPGEELAKDSETHPVPSVGNMVNFMFGDAAAQGVITEAVDGHAKVQVGDLFIQVEFKSLAHVAADTGPVAWNAVAAMPTSYKAEDPVDLAKQEADELSAVDAALTAFVKAVADIDLEKVGARNSASDSKLLQQAHDAVGKLGAKCPEPEGGFEAYANRQKEAVAGLKDGLNKGIEARLEKVEAERDDLLKQHTKLTTDYTALEARLAKVEATPAAPKGKLLVVEKNGDVKPIDGSTTDEAEDLKRFIVVNDKGEVDRAATMFKYAQSHPTPVAAK